MQEPAVHVEVWSDYVCPFCYLELPALVRLHDEVPGAAVAWRAFELRPDPAPTLDPDGEYLHRVWNASVYPMARERGMELRLPPVQPRSRLALEAAEFARGQGRFDAMHEALFRAFFRDGRDLADIGVLLDVAAAAGLDPQALGTALREGRHTAAVLADEQAAQALGISGVPGMLVHSGDRGTARRISGAQPYEALRRAVDGVLAQRCATP